MHITSTIHSSKGTQRTWFKALREPPFEPPTPIAVIGAGDLDSSINIEVDEPGVSFNLQGDLERISNDTPNQIHVRAAQGSEKESGCKGTIIITLNDGNQVAIEIRFGIKDFRGLR